MTERDPCAAHADIICHRILEQPHTKPSTSWWRTSASLVKRRGERCIAHCVIAQAEWEPVLHFLEISEAMSQTSFPFTASWPGPAVRGAEIQLQPVLTPGNGSWERRARVCARRLALQERDGKALPLRGALIQGGEEPPGHSRRLRA